MRRLSILGVAVLFGLVGCTGSESTPTGTTSSKPLHTVEVADYSAISGAPRWHLQIPGECGRVVGVGDDFLGIWTNRLTVVDRRTGQVRWRDRLVAKGWSTPSRVPLGTIRRDGPVPAGPTIVVGHAGIIQGRDPSTGRVRWRQRVDPGSLVSAGPTIVVAAQVDPMGLTTSSATAWDRATGRQHWSHQIPKVASGTTVTARALVVVEAGSSLVRGLDIETGTPRWQATMPIGGDHSIAAADGIVIIEGLSGVEAYDDRSGSKLWTSPGNDQFQLQPGTGLASVWHGDGPVRVVDLRTGATQIELADGRSFVFPVSTNRMVLQGAGYSGTDARGRVHWKIPAPDGFYKRETMQVIGNDMVTMSDRCDPG